MSFPDNFCFSWIPFPFSIPFSFWHLCSYTSVKSSFRLVASETAVREIDRHSSSALGLHVKLKQKINKLHLNPCNFTK